VVHPMVNSIRVYQSLILKPNMTAFDLTIRKAQLADLPMLPQIEDRADSLFPDNQYPDDLGLCSLQELEQAMNLNRP